MLYFLNLLYPSASRSYNNGIVSCSGNSKEDFVCSSPSSSVDTHFCTKFHPLSFLAYIVYVIEKSDDASH